jgi:dolichol-phosphate mannosyltransferase
LEEGVVIIPTYNEAGNIARILEVVLNLDVPFDVLVVDDNSPDGTAAIVKDMQLKYPGRLHILERKEKNGLGTAYIAGFKWCLAKPYTYIFEMDADFSHNPNDLPRLLDACRKSQGMSIGSRYIRGGKVSNWPMTRIMMSYFASLYVRAILWIPVMDTTAGFVCYHRSVLESINLDNIEFVGYAFQIEMKYNAMRNGFKLVEVPITFKDRLVGQSKMSMNIFTEAFLGVLKMRFK